MLRFVIVELLMWTFFFLLLLFFFFSSFFFLWLYSAHRPRTRFRYVLVSLQRHTSHNEILHNHHLVHLSNHLLNPIIISIPRSSKYLTTLKMFNPPNRLLFLARFCQQQPCRSIQLIQIIPTAITSNHHLAIVSTRFPTGDAIAAAFLRNHRPKPFGGFSGSERIGKKRWNGLKWPHFGYKTKFHKFYIPLINSSYTASWRKRLQVSVEKQHFLQWSSGLVVFKHETSTLSLS